MFFIVGHLNGPAFFRFIDGLLHRAGDLVGIKIDLAGNISGGPAAGLDQGAGGAQKAFLVGIQDGHQAYFRQIQSLPQEIDPDQTIKGPQT